MPNIVWLFTPFDLRFTINHKQPSQYSIRNTQYAPMKYKIIKTTTAYDGFLKIDKVIVEHNTFTEGGSYEKTLEVLKKGDACAALIYERDTKNLLFINQFRLPVAEHDGGWIMELVAGTVEENEAASETIIREIEEEIGYHISSVEAIAHFYVSPGWTTERIFLFFAEVESTDKKFIGGGILVEQEDIELVKIPVNEIKLRIHEIIDAKTLIAVQWFLMHKMG